MPENRIETSEKDVCFSKAGGGRFVVAQFCGVLAQMRRVLLRIA